MCLTEGVSVELFGVRMPLLCHTDYEGVLGEFLEKAFLRRPVDVEVEGLRLTYEQHEARKAQY